MLLQILSDVIYLYIVMIFLYLVIPLITYLVSLVQNASLKKNDLWCFSFLPSPPWLYWNIQDWIGANITSDCWVCLHLFCWNFSHHMYCCITGVSICYTTVTLSPSGHSVMSFPNRVLYSHTSPVDTAEDLLSQMTKLKYHVIGQVIQVMCKVIW